MDFYKILKGGVGVGMNNFDRLFAEKYGGGAWQLTTLTGVLPLTFESKGEPLTDYKIYGTSEGAGKETESGEPTGYKLSMIVTSNADTGNLINSNEAEQGEGYIANTILTKEGIQSTPYFYTSEFIPVRPGATYWLFTDLFRTSTHLVIKFYQDMSTYLSWIPRTGHTSAVDYEQANCDVFTVPSEAHYLRLSVDKESTQNMLIKAAVFPPEYVPYRYSVSIPIYIGDTKLGAEEYVDYESGKIYKRTENLFDKDNLNIVKAYINSNSIIAAYPNNGLICVPVVTGETYTISGFKRGLSTSDIKWGITASVPKNDVSCTRTGSLNQSSSLTVNIASGENYLCIFLCGDSDYNQYGSVEQAIMKNVETGMIVLGSTAPAEYIPYLNPTDPPVPLPEISTYSGENTLSCSEKLGEVSITGYIKGV